MTKRARRAQPVGAMSSGKEVADEGSERYMWAFPEGDGVVLSIPGLRDLKLSLSEARTIGEMLIRTADETTGSCKNLVEGGDDNDRYGECQIS